MAVAGAAAALLSLVSCDRGSSPDGAGQGAGSPVVARVGERAITADDVTAEARRRIERGQPVESTSSLLDEMVEREAALARVRTLGLFEDPEVKREIENLLIGQLRSRELEPRLRDIDVTDEETRAAYEARLQEFSEPAKSRLAILFLESDAKMSESKREEIRRRMEEGRALALSAPPARARGGAAVGFGNLAVDYSEDQVSRYRGGDIGWLDADRSDFRLPKEVLEAGRALEVGEVSAIVEAEDGLYVVKKSDAREAVVRSFDDARTTLRQSLLVEKRRAAEEAFLKESRQGVEISVDDKALAGVSLPEPERVAQAERPGDAGGPPSLPGTGSPSPPTE